MHQQSPKSLSEYSEASSSSWLGSFGSIINVGSFFSVETKSIESVPHGSYQQTISAATSHMSLPTQFAWEHLLLAKAMEKIEQDVIDQVVNLVIALVENPTSHSTDDSMCNDMKR